MSKTYVIPSKRGAPPPTTGVICAEITEKAFPTLGSAVNKKMTNAAVNYKMSVIDGEEKKRQEELVRLQEEGWAMLTIPPVGTNRFVITTGLGEFKVEETPYQPKPFNALDDFDYYEEEEEEEEILEEEPEEEEEVLE